MRSLRLFARFLTILGSEFRRRQRVRPVHSAFVIAALQFCLERSPRCRRVPEMGKRGYSKSCRSCLPATSKDGANISVH